MPRAESQNTIVAPAVQRTSPPGPAITNIDPSGLPDIYAMRVSGACMMPEIADNDLLHYDTREPVKAGDLVIIFFRPELIAPGDFQAKCKRLVTNISEWVTFPWRDKPGSEISPLIVVEMTNPRRQFAYACSAILAVHKCIGHLAEDMVTEKILAPKLKPARARRARKTGGAHVW